MSGKARRLIFICDDGTHRSLIAASLAKHLWKDAVEVSMVAIAPNPIHPETYELLKRHTVEPFRGHVQNLKNVDLSQSEIVITLSSLAEEEAPNPPPRILKFYWWLPNAVQFRGSAEDSREIFERIFIEIEGNLKEISKHVISN